jgi:hypothetical protein
MLFRTVKIINLEMSANWEYLGAEESIIFVIPYYFMQDTETFWNKLYFYISKSMVSRFLYVSMKQELTSYLLPSTTNPLSTAAAFQNIGF